MQRFLLPLILLSVTSPALAGKAPIGVSPGGPTGVARVGTVCPTFHWTTVSTARSYELRVYRVGAEAVAPELAVRLPGAVSGWTPTLEQCLEEGGDYAWSVAAVGKRGAASWSSPVLFRVSAAPARSDALAFEASSRDHRQERVTGGSAPEVQAASPRPAGSGGANVLFPSIAQGAPPIPRAATPPASGSPSLSVDGQIHLGPDSDFFRAGSVFLWQDGDSFALGSDALANNEQEGIHNMAVGIEALRFNTTGVDNTALGFSTLRLNQEGSSNVAIGRSTLQKATGNNNTAVGAFALAELLATGGNTAVGSRVLEQSTGFRNTAIGTRTMRSATSAVDNIAMGFQAAMNLVDGNRNIVLGFDGAATLTSGSDNILLGADATTAAESDTIRIGSSQTRAFLAGVDGVTTAGAAVPVLVDPSGQLGTVSASSARFKSDIRDLGAASDGLLRLRPVTFRYRREIDPSEARHYGLIAEEVREVLPDLVQLSAEGEAQGVRYDLLNVLLLNELQKQAKRLAELGEENRHLRRQAERARSQATRELGRLAARISELESAR